MDEPGQYYLGESGERTDGVVDGRRPERAGADLWANDGGDFRYKLSFCAV
jgi:hypothetical protein